MSSVASRNNPPTAILRAAKQAKDSSIKRRFCCLVFGHGSGKKTAISASAPSAKNNRIAATASVGAALTLSIPRSRKRVKSAPQAGAINLDGDEVGARRRQRPLREGFAVAAADFGAQRRATTKNPRPIRACTITVRKSAAGFRSAATTGARARACPRVGRPARRRHKAAGGAVAVSHSRGGGVSSKRGNSVNLSMVALGAKSSQGSNIAPPRRTQTALQPAPRAPVTSKGFDDTSQVDSACVCARRKKCAYTAGEGLKSRISSALTMSAKKSAAPPFSKTSRTAARAPFEKSEKRNLRPRQRFERRADIGEKRQPRMRGEQARAGGGRQIDSNFGANCGQRVAGANRKIGVSAHKRAAKRIFQLLFAPAGGEFGGQFALADFGGQSKLADFGGEGAANAGRVDQSPVDIESQNDFCAHRGRLRGGDQPARDEQFRDLDGV